MKFHVKFQGLFEQFEITNMDYIHMAKFLTKVLAKFEILCNLLKFVPEILMKFIRFSHIVKFPFARWSGLGP